MEDILSEILNELKEINHKLYERDKTISVTTTIDGDIITGKVIESIIKQNRRFGKSTINDAV